MRRPSPQVVSAGKDRRVADKLIAVFGCLRRLRLKLAPLPHASTQPQVARRSRVVLIATCKTGEWGGGMAGGLLEMTTGGL